MASTFATPAALSSGSALAPQDDEANGPILVATLSQAGISNTDIQKLEVRRLSIDRRVAMLTQTRTRTRLLTYETVLLTFSHACGRCGALSRMRDTIPSSGAKPDVIMSAIQRTFEFHAWQLPPHEVGVVTL